ncbi:MAG: amidophosphoribosyltransferase, partial [Synergistaceae bacterium]|nr:amidophosphoribosyltransferase [Synergistaceae bacterium]
MCGVFGAYSGRDRVAEEVYLGLLALQHRGQESAGVAWIDDFGRVNV